MKTPGRPAFVAAVIFVLALSAGAAARDHLVTVAPRVRLFVRELGRGSPLVVLHGGPGLDLSYLAPDLEPLTRRHRVIFYDQRGSGRSSPAQNVTADVLVADLDALRRRLNFRRLTLLGHSWGGGLAALYAMAHPDRVDRLILTGPMPPTAKGLARFADALQSRLSVEENLALYKVETERGRARGAEQVALCRDYWSILGKAYYADPAAATKSRGDTCAAPPAALASGLQVNASVLKSLGDWDWRARLADLRVPTLVIHGDADPIPLDTAREWAAAIPNARLVVIPNAGHMSYVEQPDLFFAVVEDFLR